MESCEFDKKSAKQSDLRAPLTQPYSQIQRHNAVYTKNCRNLLGESLLIFTCYQSLSSVSSIHKEAKILAFARLYEKQFHLIYRQNWIMSVCNTCPGKECAHTKERDGRARGIGQFPFERFQFSCLLAPNRRIVSFYPPKMPCELDLLLLRLDSRKWFSHSLHLE